MQNEDLRPEFYSAYLAFEAWVVHWTMLMVSEWSKDRYPEEME